MKFLLADIKVKNQIVDFLENTQNYFDPPLFDRILSKSSVNNISLYVDKILKYGAVFCCIYNNEIVGLVAIYANDIINFKAYIPILVVKDSFKGKGIAINLLNQAINFAKEKQMKIVELKTWKSNIVAQKLYTRLNFKSTETQTEIIFFKYL